MIIYSFLYVYMLPFAVSSPLIMQFDVQGYPGTFHTAVNLLLLFWIWKNQLFRPSIYPFDITMRHSNTQAPRILDCEMVFGALTSMFKTSSVVCYLQVFVSLVKFSVCISHHRTAGWLFNGSTCRVHQKHLWGRTNASLYCRVRSRRPGRRFQLFKYYCATVIVCICTLLAYTAYI